MANYISPGSMYTTLIGKKIDVDGFPSSQPYQCYDLFAWYCRHVWGFIPYCRPSGYVRDIAQNFVGMGLDKYFTKVPLSQAKDGDWIVWGNAPATPLSHIAMFRKFSGSQILALQQNAPSPYVTQNLITKNGVIAVLRTKKPAPKTFKVKTTNVANVRKAPKITATIVKKLAKGSVFNAVGTVKGSSVSGDDKWYKTTHNHYVWSGNCKKV